MNTTTTAEAALAVVSMAMDDLRSVMCDPDGNVCVSGSEEDIRILQAVLAQIDAELNGQDHD